MLCQKRERTFPHLLLNVFSDVNMAGVTEDENQRDDNSDETYNDDEQNKAVAKLASYRVLPRGFLFD